MTKEEVRELILSNRCLYTEDLIELLEVGITKVRYYVLDYLYVQENVQEKDRIELKKIIFGIENSMKIKNYKERIKAEVSI